MKKSNTYDFQNYKTIKSLEEKIYSGIIVLNDAFEEKINLKMRLINFMNPKNKTKIKKRKEKKC